MGKRKGKNSRIKRKSATETVQKEPYVITPKVESNVPKTARPYTATNNDKEKRYILSKYVSFILRLPNPLRHDIEWYCHVLKTFLFLFVG